MKQLQEESIVEAASHNLGRRRFLQFAGAFAGAGLLVGATGCSKDKNNPIVTDDAINLGSGDVGILNYAYALEQLEAAFYTQVIKTPYTNMPAAELSLLTDIRDHEIAHREFFKAALGTSAIPALEVNFSAITFTSRDSVLATAKAFEDLGVSAYNGAGKLITNVDYLLLAGKIVSVEARHAAYIRDLISNGSFADSPTVNASTGLDTSNDPATVLATAANYLKSKLNASNLPTS